MTEVRQSTYNVLDTNKRSSNIMLGNYLLNKARNPNARPVISIKDYNQSNVPKIDQKSIASIASNVLRTNKNVMLSGVMIRNIVSRTGYSSKYAFLQNYAISQQQFNKVSKNILQKLSNSSTEIKPLKLNDKEIDKMGLNNDALKTIDSLTDIIGGEWLKIVFQKINSYTNK